MNSLNSALKSQQIQNKKLLAKTSIILARKNKNFPRSEVNS